MAVATGVDGLEAQAVATAMSTRDTAAAIVGARAAATVADGLGLGNIGGTSLDPASRFQLYHAFISNARILVRNRRRMERFNTHANRLDISTRESTIPLST